jgi:hypothetical protein
MMPEHSNRQRKADFFIRMYVFVNVGSSALLPYILKTKNLAAICKVFIKGFSFPLPHYPHLIQQPFGITEFLYLEQCVAHIQ